MDRTINYLFNLGDDKKPVPVSMSFLIDLSGSMHGEPLEKAKQALVELLIPITQGLDLQYVAEEVTLFTFHTEVKRITPFVDKNNYEFFKDCLFEISEKVFGDSGCTSLYDGVYESLTALDREATKENEKILIIFSDGGENSSNKKKHHIEELISKLQQGYTDKSNEDFISATGNNVNLSDFFEDMNNDILIFKIDALDKIEKSSLDDDTKNKLRNLIYESRNPVKIFTVYYKWEDTQGRGFKILKSLSDFTYGKVYETLTSDKIPDILSDIFHDNIIRKTQSLRSLLINRLENCSFNKEYIKQNGYDPNHFRVISVNYGKINESKYFISGNNSDGQSYKHSVFNIIEHKPDLIKRNILKAFEDDFKGRILADLQLNLNLPVGAGIANNNFVVTFSFRVSDLLGLSLIYSIRELTDGIIRNRLGLGGNINIQYSIILLFDEWLQFTDDNKKNFASFIAEAINVYSDSYDTMFLVGDKNTSPTNDKTGFNSLKTNEYEDMIVDILANININDVLSIVKHNYNDDKMFAIGVSTLALDRNNIINTLSDNYLNHLLNDLFNENEFVPFHNNVIDQVKFKTDEFINSISFTSVHDSVSKINNTAIYDYFGFNDLTTFGIFKHVIEPFIKIRNKKTKFEYLNEIEYIQYVFKDIKEYVSLSFEIKEIEAKIRNNFSRVLSETTTRLRNNTDFFLYGYESSSPVLSLEWIKGCKDRMENKLIHITSEINDNELNKQFQEFRIVDTDGKEIKEQEKNPDYYFQRIVNKLKGYPLKQAARFKYHSISLMLTIGILAALLGFALPPVFLSLFAFPLAFSSFGEYKIYTSRKQIKNLLFLLKQVLEYKAKLEIFNIIRIKYEAYIKEIIAMIGNPEASEESYKFKDIDVISESAYLSHFKKGIDNMINITKFENESVHYSSSFYHELTREMRFGPAIFPAVLKNNGNITDNLPESSVYYQATLIQTSDSFRTTALPFVEVSVFPSEAFSRLDVKLKLKFFIASVNNERTIIYQLQHLAADEQKTFKSLLSTNDWDIKTDNLFIKFADFINPPFDQQININLFALWRDIARYHIWLKSIKETDNFNSSHNALKNLYDLWKRVFQVKSDFKKALKNHIENEIRGILGNNLSLWKSVEEYSERDRFIKALKGFSFPSLYINHGTGLYPTTKKSLYFCSFGNHPNTVLQNQGCDIQQHLTGYHIYAKDAHIGQIAEKSDYTVSFVSFVPLSLRDGSVPVFGQIKGICTPDLKDNENYWLTKKSDRKHKDFKYPPVQ